MRGGTRGNALTVAVIAVLTAGFLFWEVGQHSLTGYGAVYAVSDADEWRYAACSRLVANGYHLFSQVYSAQPPLLFLSLAAGMRLLGDGIGAGRWVELLYGLIALLSVATIAWRLGGRAAAVLATLLLAVTPTFLVYSHAVEAEVPMMALGALSLALAVAAPGARRSSLLYAAAGLALAGAVLLKLFAAELLLPALWVLRPAGRPSLRQDGARLGTFGVAFVAPIVLEFLLLAPADQLRQVVLLHSGAAALDLPGAQSTASIFSTFAALDPGLILLAIGGLVALVCTRQWNAAIFCLLWAGGTVLMLGGFHPLFPHHMAILAAPLATTGGIGMGSLARVPLHRNRIVAFAGVVLLLYVAAGPRLLRLDRHLLVPGVQPSALPLATWLRARSRPSAIIASDDLRVTEGAARQVPPPLCDPSNVRLYAGDLTAATAISATRSYHAAIVMPLSGTYNQIPGYLLWVRRHYHRTHAPGATVYVARSR